LRQRINKERLSVRALAASMNDSVVSAHAAIEVLMLEAHSLDARDTALLRALLSGSLRWHHRLQSQLATLLDHKLQKVDPILQALIRVGLFQLAEMRIPDHAAVSATVDAASELGFGRAKGLVNAMLRRFLREREQLERDVSRQVRFSHPEWLIQEISVDWPQCHDALLNANNERAPLWIRVNTARITRGDYLELLAAQDIAADVDPSSAAAIRVETPCSTESLPGYATGLVSIQDGSAQRAAELIDLAPGQRVLDACAAPGGKTAHMLERCPDLQQLVALDRDEQRLAHVGEQLGRLGLDATMIRADAASVEQWWDGRPFDRILLDAPCSATGVIRRHPEIKVLRTSADVSAAVELQASLLNALWPLLRPGGRMLYATCSVLSRENSAQTNKFLATHADAFCDELGSATHFRVPTGEVGMDGFYYACIDRLNGRTDTREPPRQ
jgi:16S rRNA (cytosine967-C5)-methyltransferase